jgi:hypothetical protein
VLRLPLFFCLMSDSSFQESKQARLAAESALRSLISQMLNSGINLAQIAQMMNLSTSEMQGLIGRDFGN